MRIAILAAEERRDFARLLTGLDAKQWSAPSLCQGWRVKDVVAHVIAYLDRGRDEFIATLAGHGFRIDRLNSEDVDRLSTSPHDLLTNVLYGNAVPRGVGSSFGARVALLECIVHQQDVRRALGLPRVIPADRLETALAFSRVAPLIRGAWYSRGVRLIATDVQWSAGRGPEVRGPGEALLLMMARRPGALADLTGPGTAVLRERL